MKNPGEFEEAAAYGRKFFWWAKAINASEMEERPVLNLQYSVMLDSDRWIWHGQGELHKWHITLRASSSRSNLKSLS
jgi:hypothetical protein